MSIPSCHITLYYPNLLTTAMVYHTSQIFHDQKISRIASKMERQKFSRISLPHCTILKWPQTVSLFWLYTGTKWQAQFVSIPCCNVVSIGLCTVGMCSIYFVVAWCFMRALHVQCNTMLCMPPTADEEFNC